MKKFILLAWIPLFSFLGMHVMAHAELNDRVALQLANRFHLELKCQIPAQEPNRHFCPVSLLAKEKLVLPSVPTTLIGLTIELPEGGTIAQSLLKTTNLAVLTLDPNSARLTDLKPSNEGEKKELSELIASVSLSLKGMTQTSPIPVSQGLAGFLKGENAKAGHPLKVEGNGASYRAALPSRIYQVGNLPYGKAYLVLEEAQGSWIVSIFPAVGYQVKN